MIARLLRIHGKVQGVYYRDTAVSRAADIGVHGWVRNRHDGTVEALVVAGKAGIIQQSDADALIEAWLLVTKIRNGVVLWRGKPADSMVETSADRTGLAHLFGLPPEHSEEMVNDYLRVTRRARRVVERVFYDG